MLTIPSQARQNVTSRALGGCFKFPAHLRKEHVVDDSSVSFVETVEPGRKAVHFPHSVSCGQLRFTRRKRSRPFGRAIPLHRNSTEANDYGRGRRMVAAGILRSHLRPVGAPKLLAELSEVRGDGFTERWYQALPVS